MTRPEDKGQSLWSFFHHQHSSVTPRQAGINAPVVMGKFAGAFTFSWSLGRAMIGHNGVCTKQDLTPVSLSLSDQRERVFIGSSSLTRKDDLC